MQHSFAVIVAVLATSPAYATYTFVRRGCDFLSCGAALGPTFVSCGYAAIEAGLDPFEDADCLASAANSIINLPPSCEECAQQYSTLNAFGEATSAVESVASEATSILGSIF